MIVKKQVLGAGEEVMIEQYNRHVSTQEGPATHPAELACTEEQGEEEGSREEGGEDEGGWKAEGSTENDKKRT